MFWSRTDRLEQIVRDAVDNALAGLEKDLRGLRTVSDLEQRIKDLRSQNAQLEVEKSKKEEEFARREREVEHKVGLERKRQEFELSAAKREAIVAVREENLAADRARFETLMAQQEERSNELRSLLADVMQRLPSATIEITETRKPSRRK